MRPQTGDFNEYFGKYINLVKSDDIVHFLSSSLEERVRFFNQIPKEKWDFSYAEGKWTIKEMMLHIIDTERIMVCRALRVGRGDMTPIPGFEQDDYVPTSEANKRTPESLIEEFEAQRRSTILFFSHFSDEMFSRKGIASNNEITALALAFIVGGHEIHHIKVLNERYF